MEQKYKYMVATRCFTFNHAPYIEDAMNGFAIQKTTFPVVTLIVDDASTDGEQDIIRNYLQEHFVEPYREEETEYAHIVCAMHKTNANCIFVVFLLKYNHHSIKKSKMDYLSEWLDNAKYHAFCEGDDYWIDNHKLQKQVDYLESHEDCILVHSNFQALNNSTKEILYNASSRYKIVDGYVFNNLFDGCFVRYLTVCYRNLGLLSSIPIPTNAFAGDLLLFYVLSKNGKFKFFNEEMGVYRVLPHSATHFKSEGERFTAYEKYKNLDFFIADYYNISKEKRSKLKVKWFVLDFKHALFANDYKYLKGLQINERVSSLYKSLYMLCQYKPLFEIISFIIRKRQLVSRRKRWF